MSLLRRRHRQRRKIHDHSLTIISHHVRLVFYMRFDVGCFRHTDSRIANTPADSVVVALCIPRLGRSMTDGRMDRFTFSLTASSLDLMDSSVDMSFSSRAFLVAIYLYKGSSVFGKEGSGTLGNLAWRFTHTYLSQRHRLLSSSFIISHLSRPSNGLLYSFL